MWWYQTIFPRLLIEYPWSFSILGRKHDLNEFLSHNLYTNDAINDLNEFYHAIYIPMSNIYQFEPPKKIDCCKSVQTFSGMCCAFRDRIGDVA